MTSSFHEALASDAIAFLAEFGEAIVYYAEGILGAPRSIQAVIRRPEHDNAPETDGALMTTFTLEVANDAVTGITRFDPRDLALIPRSFGDPVATRVRITKEISKDAGLIVLEAII